MIYAVCIDDRGGMAFMGKRLSRDRVQLERLFSLVGEGELLVTPYSERLVEGFPRVRTVRDVRERAQDAVLFLETVDPTPLLQGGDTLAVYRFGRHYPSDLRLTADLSRMELVSACAFVGSSHPDMTETLYRVTP